MPRRWIYSLGGRAEPRRYAAGWLLSLVGLGALVAVAAAGLSGTSRGVAGLAIASIFELALVLLSVGLVTASLAQGSQRRADGWQDYSGPSPFLVVLAWLSLSLAVELAIVAAIGFVGINLATSIETLLVLLLNLACFVALVQLVVVRPGALSWGDMARPRRLAPDPSDWSFSYNWTGGPAGWTNRNPTTLARDVGLGLTLAIPVLIGTLIFTGILATILGVRNTDVSEPIPTLFPGWDLWITLVSLAIVAPIGEEIFFRGFATNAWARSLRRNDAIIRAAIFFACVHIINLIGAVDVDVFIRVAILAVAARIPVAWVLSWIYARRRSIYASAALHAAYNGALVLVAWWISEYVLR
ncbi:MAG: CPBP family intramembrane glutamic endopeptidase [Candidatus Limnocylindrales bacterium]